MARKLSPRQRREQKRQKRVRLFMGIFIIAIMVLSTIAFVVVFYTNQNQQGQGYDFDYEIRENQLLVRTDQGVVPFVNFPDQRYVLPDSATPLLQNAQTVVIAFDPQDQELASYTEQVRFDLLNYMPIAGARTQNSSAYASLPIVDCSDATQQSPVVVLNNHTAGVNVTSSCITFGVQGQDVLFVRDALLYSYFDLL